MSDFPTDTNRVGTATNFGSRKKHGG